MIFFLACFSSGFLFGLYAYGKGLRAQSPFYKTNS